MTGGAQLAFAKAWRTRETSKAESGPERAGPGRGPALTLSPVSAWEAHTDPARQGEETPEHPNPECDSPLNPDP